MGRGREENHLARPVGCKDRIRRRRVSAAEPCAAAGRKPLRDSRSLVCRRMVVGAPLPRQQQPQRLPRGRAEAERGADRAHSLCAAELPPPSLRSQPKGALWPRPRSLNVARPPPCTAVCSGAEPRSAHGRLFRFLSTALKRFCASKHLPDTFPAK